MLSIYPRLETLFLSVHALFVLRRGKKKGKKRERKIVKYFLTKALNADYRCWTEIATWDV